MSVIERQFEYRGPKGQMHLLGGLMVIMGPAVWWMSMQEGTAGDQQALAGPASLAMFRALAIIWCVRFLAIAVVWAGILIVKGAFQASTAGGKITFTQTGLIFEACLPESVDREIAYARIQEVKTTEQNGVRKLTFKIRGLTDCSVLSSQMRTSVEFEEMAGMLAERAGRAIAS